MLGFVPISGQKLFGQGSGLFGLVLGPGFVAEGFLNGILLLFVKFWIDVQRYYVSKLQNFKKFKIKKKCPRACPVEGVNLKFEVNQ